MKINGNITFIYKDEKNAKLSFDSLEVDNENFLRSKLNGNSIDYNMESEKLGSFLATVDDLVASEIVVEKIITKTKQ
ncbi:KEOPS complex subunit Pcc1 [Methanobrevibacter sp.]|uniref:KEOPS complex subunit Pcc1 n=1 Tax=Methanobrevibacter sp. TaxID=66852 RepID=UPI003864821B